MRRDRGCLAYHHNILGICHPTPGLSKMSAALVRASLFVITTSLQTLSVAPPNPAPDEALQKRFLNPARPPTVASPDGDTHGIRPKRQKLRSRLGTFYFPYAFIAFFWILTMLEVPRSFNHEDPLNFRFVSGTLVASLASMLRFASFRALGHHFTYQLAILPSHKLVTTGPYAYVRHPSYTALPLIISGCALSFTSRGTVLREWIGESGGADRTVFRALVGMLYVGWQFVKRAKVEDQVLKEEFGEEWEKWARVVKYRFIPGIY
jgi:protein-S-isoprenylcysteine O-methyltransferase Ste14